MMARVLKLCRDVTGFNFRFQGELLPQQGDQYRSDEGFSNKVFRALDAAAEAEQLAAIPTAKVLKKRQTNAEQALLRAERLSSAQSRLGFRGARRHAVITAKGQLERDELYARGERAVAHRQVETHPDVQADRLARQRQRATVVAGLMIVGAMAFTSVNVHTFIAGTAQDWSPLWVTGWVVDPVLTGFVVWLLWTRADMAAIGRPIHYKRDAFTYWVMLAMELVTSAATVTMNIIPELNKGKVNSGSVAIHIFIPLVGICAIFALPLIQSLYADRINAITQANNTAPVEPVHDVQNPYEQPKNSDNGGLSERVQIGVSKVRKAIESGQLALPLKVRRVEKFIRDEVGTCSVPTAQEVIKFFQNEAPELTVN